MVPVPSSSRYYHGTAIPLIPRYYRTVLANKLSFQRRFLCDKNQVNKLEVFKLHVDDIFGATDGDSPMGLLYCPAEVRLMLLRCSAVLCHHVSDSSLMPVFHSHVT